MEQTAMEFKFIEKESTSARCNYYAEEESLRTEGGNPGASICIEDTYLTIDIDTDTGNFTGISGFLGDIWSLPSRNVADIRYRTGMLVYRDYQNLEKGIGYAVGYRGKILFDKTNKMIVILMKNQSKTGEWFRVASNIFLLLNHGILSEIRIDIK